MTLPGLWHARPVFISSTFRDMHAERDWLRTRVLPELEERLRGRRCHLEPIDLRWGVEASSEVDEQVREMRVLRVCLAEVERSRPFLIGLLGDRYGWVPPADRMEAAAKEAGFEGPVAGRSVTDLEIDYGVLSSQVQQRRCFFYFRAPLPYGEMPKEVAAEYSEAHHSALGAAEAAQKLASLKKRIETQFPGRVRHYRAQWDRPSQSVVGLEEWGKQILEDLWRELDAETAEYVHGGEATWQEAERFALDELVEGRARGFVGREEMLRELLDLAGSPVEEGTPWGAYVTGPAGAGKSALFGELYRRLRGRGVFVLAHAAGVSPHSAQVDAMLRRWVGELAVSLGMADPLDDKAKEVEKTFHELLGRASVQKRVVLLVDALNQFEPTARARQLTWLPRLWPDGARIIATAIPGSETEALAKRPGTTRVSLPALNEVEAAQIARALCKRYHRELNAQVLSSLLAKRRAGGEIAAGSPLWLELAVEELNLLDAADFVRTELEFRGRPADRLLGLLLAVVEEMPPDIEGLYGWMLDRAEQLFGKPWAQGFMNLIAVSRAGWRESDLRLLIPRVSGEPWDPLTFASLRRIFRAHVVRKGGQTQWDFAHSQMRLAVTARNLPSEETARHLHQAIAEHLLALPKEDPLHENETMVHFVGADDRLTAARYYASELTEGENAGATRVLADHLVADAEEPGAGCAWVGSLLEPPELTDIERGRLCQRFVFDLHDALENQARLGTRGRIDGYAHPVLVRLAAMDPKRVEWQRDLSVSHERIGDVLFAQGDAVGALTAYQAAHAIFERLVALDPEQTGWQRDLSVSHLLIGDVLLAQGDAAGALATYRVSLVIRQRLVALDPKQTGWQRDLSVSHERIGDILLSQGDAAEALATYRASLVIRENLSALDPKNAKWQRDFSVIVLKIGSVLLAQGDTAGALAAYRASLVIHERLVALDPKQTEWQRDLSVSHARIGDVLFAQGDAVGALAAYRASLVIRERLVAPDPKQTEWQLDLSASHSRIGDVLRAQGDATRALTAYRASLAIRERLVALDPKQAEWQRGLSVIYLKIGDVVRSRGDTAAVLAAYRAAHVIFERLVALDPKQTEWQRDLSVSHERIGDVLRTQGDAAGLLAASRASLAIREHLAALDPNQTEWQRDLSVSHERTGVALLAQGDGVGALAAFRASLAIRERLVALDPKQAKWQRDLSVIRNRIGDVLLAQGDNTGALAAFRASLAIREYLAALDPKQAEWQRDLSVSCYKIALLFAQLGSDSEASAHLRRCYEILLGMKCAGMHLDPPAVAMLEELSARFGGLRGSDGSSG